MRNLADIIDKMIKHIPKNSTAIDSLKSLKESCFYAAPELQPELWHRCALILNNELTPIDTDWKQQIADIFADKK